jgi:hypothetical protein
VLSLGGQLTADLAAAVSIPTVDQLQSAAQSASQEFAAARALVAGANGLPAAAAAAAGVGAT